jgi:ribose 5-phosphate isomerase B
MKILGIAADHGGFQLKNDVFERLKKQGHEVKDFGAFEFQKDDDYPDFVIPLARAVSDDAVQRGIAICGSGVGAGITANKVPGVRAALVHDSFSAHQGVEDDNMNIICLGGRVVASELAWELIQLFLNAEFKKLERFERRLAKMSALEK